MKPFFSTETHTREAVLDDLMSREPGHATRSARIAVYDSDLSAPRVVNIEAEDPASFIEDVASRTYSLTRDMGGPAPYTAIREVVENLIHADFSEPVVSILDDGHTLRFADQGPGITDKDRARLPGFTTATRDMKAYIRGVGSGLPIVLDYLGHTGGDLRIEDNLGSGTVVTLSFRSTGRTSPVSPEEPARYMDRGHRGLTTRQVQVLSLVMETGEAGPTLVARELGVGLSTAFRDLGTLEKAGLIESDDVGKRVLTSSGQEYLDDLLKR